jgi:hypothetical protein
MVNVIVNDGQLKIEAKKTIDIIINKILSLIRIHLIRWLLCVCNSLFCFIKKSIYFQVWFDDNEAF